MGRVSKTVSGFLAAVRALLLKAHGRGEELQAPLGLAVGAQVLGPLALGVGVERREANVQAGSFAGGLTSFRAVWVDGERRGDPSLQALSTRPQSVCWGAQGAVDQSVDAQKVLWVLQGTE